MPLIVRYKTYADASAVAGKADALENDAKTARVVALLCEAELGATAAAALDATAQADFAAQWAAQQMRLRAKRYRNARAIAAQEAANDAADDL